MSTQVNQWHTPVQCSVFVDTRQVSRRTFSDAQMAYLWVQQQIHQSRFRDWVLKPFDTVCEELSRDYGFTQIGVRPAYTPSDSGTYYRLEYAPEPLQ